MKRISIQEYRNTLSFIIIIGDFGPNNIIDNREATMLRN